MLRLLIPTSTSVFSRLSLAVQSQWCQNIASRIIIGSGIPKSQSSIPRPSPMADLQFVCRPNNVDSPQEFQTPASRFARGMSMDRIPSAGARGGTVQSSPVPLDERAGDPSGLTPTS